MPTLLSLFIFSIPLFILAKHTPFQNLLKRPIVNLIEADYILLRAVRGSARVLLWLFFEQFVQIKTLGLDLETLWRFPASDGSVTKL
jgi:hypothetical protein